MSDRDITLREFVEHGIEHMEVLRVEPGDVCVVRSDRALSGAEIDRINHEWDRAFRGYDVPALLILDRSISLGVLRPPATAQGEAAPTSEPGK